ncbi:hypothetical protein BHE74_00001766 [Ensete ventricosum]|nr:hypothetical protein GW17_00024109 [Ensete ventricosum]RWW89304.1 hypothetical protein BHE74_00001766 [Ensete ventricosum]RZR90034.1 hypothetical protein BHM03_00017855 [Ensete ventricosum]
MFFFFLYHVQLEGSGNWPVDHVAIEKTKSAFLLKIGERYRHDEQCCYFIWQENFMLSRKSYEENAQNIEPAVFLAAPYDKASEAWTRYSPNRSVSDFLDYALIGILIH